MVTTQEQTLPDADLMPVKNIWRSVRKMQHTGKGLRNDSRILKYFNPEDIPILKELYEQSSTFAKFAQMDSLFNNLQILQRMRKEYKETGKLHPQYHQVQKNVDSLTAKVRKQEEGIMIKGEVIHTHDQIRKVIELQEYAVKNPDAIRKKRELVRGSSIFQSPKLEE